MFARYLPWWAATLRHLWTWRSRCQPSRGVYTRPWCWKSPC